jgi:HTH-type transcriptional regulator/antitoxin HipB
MEELVVSPETLGRALKRQRKAKGVTQQQAGEAFRLDQGTVSDIENGSRGTRLETLFRLLAALDLEMVIRSKKPFSPQDNGEGW